MSKKKRTGESREDRDAGTEASRDASAFTLRIVAACATVLVVVMLAGLIVNFVNIGKLNAERAAMRQELAELTRKIERNETLLEDRTTDAYLEQLAREELGMVKEGELVYVE